MSIDDAFFFFQAEDGIRDLVRSRGLGDVYKRQPLNPSVGGCSCLVVKRLGGDSGVGVAGRALGS